MTRITPVHIRRLALLAIIGGVVGLLYWPFYATAFFATPSGADSADPWWVSAWSGPFAAAVGPMLTFASAHEVYVTYGKAFNLVIAGHLAGLVALHAWQRAPERRFERATFRFALTATGLMAVASVFLYWIPQPYWDRYVDYAFMGLAVPGFLLTLIAYPLFGWATIRARVAPRAVGWLLALGAFPGILLLTTLTGSLSGGLVGLHVAWITVGLAIRRSRATEVPVPRAAPTAEGS